MGRMGRMGRMIMGQWDEGTITGTMGLWDGTPRPVLLSSNFLFFAKDFFANSFVTMSLAL